jgi:hypothetical protein
VKIVLLESNAFVEFLMTFVAFGEEVETDITGENSFLGTKCRFSREYTNYSRKKLKSARFAGKIQI